MLGNGIGSTLGNTSRWPRLRKALFDVYYAGAIPSTLPSVVTSGAFGFMATSPADCSASWELTCPTVGGVSWKVHRITPSAPRLNKAAFIWGANAAAHYASPEYGFYFVTQELLRAGWDVYGLSMPCNSYNPDPVTFIAPDGVSCPFDDTNDASFAETHGLSPLRIFTDASHVAMNHAMSLASPPTVCIGVGFSGGANVGAYVAATDAHRYKRVYLASGESIYVQPPLSYEAAAKWFQQRTRSWWGTICPGTSTPEEERLLAMYACERGNRIVRLFQPNDLFFPSFEAEGQLRASEAKLSAWIPPGQSVLRFDVQGTGKHEITAAMRAYILADAATL